MFAVWFIRRFTCLSLSWPHHALCFTSAQEWLSLEKKNRFITLIYTSQQSAHYFVLGKRLTLTGLNLAVPFYFRDDYGTLVAMKIKGIKR